MKIVITTPLFPPDTADLALYTKELVTRLSQNHTVTVVLYGKLPENVAGVKFVCIDKHAPLLMRIFLYTVRLWKEVKKADTVYSQNGPSVEFPIGLISMITTQPLIMHFGDISAHKRAQQQRIFKLIEKFGTHNAKEVLTDTPVAKPEILPFKPKPEIELKRYATSWNAHIAVLENLFKKYA